MSGNNSKDRNKKSNLVLEEVPDIKDKLIRETEKSGGFLAIAQSQESIFLSNDKDKIFSIAQRLNVAYNTDLLAELESKAEQAQQTGNEDRTTANMGEVKKCSNCNGEAEKKCSQCLAVYYCSR